MEKNEITKERYALKLLNAMEDADMTNAETAERFDFSVTYLSHIKRKENFHRVPPKAWDRIRDWHYSDIPLREYRWKGVQPETEPEDARDRAEMKFRSKLAVKGLLKEHSKEVAEAVVESVNTEGSMNEPDPNPEERAKIAEKLRQEYEAVQPQDEIKIVAHKGGKVDVSKLDPRTGQVAAYELQIMDDGSPHISYRFKS